MLLYVKCSEQLSSHTLCLISSTLATERKSAPEEVAEDEACGWSAECCSWYKSLTKKWRQRTQEKWEKGSERGLMFPQLCLICSLKQQLTAALRIGLIRWLNTTKKGRGQESFFSKNEGKVCRVPPWNNWENKPKIKLSSGWNLTSQLRK